jgi:hypothetical protein
MKTKEYITEPQDATVIFPIQKIPFAGNLITIYHRVHDLSHRSKYFVGEFVRCDVVTLL